ncbi:telomere length regulation protein-domain-containing protein [Crucibulum laeve]|uniref:Telomere length regulation protein-domain-containing protein n=1 Tax=Crucibulum laeve TaxID=68775 RepID=A0A5C3MG75_9AGAR|nr:telomere length regulation protein-domain-containing protein [Crucibulum laeve]
MDDHDAAKDVIERLKVPIPDLPTLLSLLVAPLESLGLLPPRFRRYNLNPLPANAINPWKHIPPIQRSLIQHILPTWDTLLAENDATSVVDQYFCPDSFSNASQTAGKLAILSYSTLITLPFTEYSMRILEHLAVEYPVDRLHTATFGWKEFDLASRNVTWEDCIRSIVMVPAKVANAVGGQSVMPGLEHGAYFNQVSKRTEVLIHTLSSQPSPKDALHSVTYLIVKLVNLGVFPPTPPTARSQPSFFQTALPTIRSRLKAEDAKAYSSCWSTLMLDVPSSLSLRSILTSLFASLSTVEPSLDPSLFHRVRVKEETQILSEVVGCVTPDKEELWETATSLIIGRDWDEARARIFICWVSGGSMDGKVNLKALGAFLDSVLEIWSSSTHIKHSLLSRHRYTTSLLLITASYFPPSSKEVNNLALSPLFIQAISTYISHLDHSVRRCGMLAAEVIAHLINKRLDFGEWDGDDSGKPWARELQNLLKARDVDVDTISHLGTDDIEIEEITAPDAASKASATARSPKPHRAAFASSTSGYDSDDSVTGYASEQSSRSNSPTPSELAEIEKDPTLNVGVKKVARPVYLAQLGELLRGGGNKVGPDDPHEADKIEVALDYAEELIRKKRGFGTELSENAVNLVYALLGLHNNYNLDGFEVKRQGALNALVACCPRKSAPALIEEYFKNQYSADQRYVALNALALGARELASLPVPPSIVPVERTSFPSKTLPPALHRRYITNEANTKALRTITDDITRLAIDKQKEPETDKVPELVRERRLRLKKPTRIMEMTQSAKPSFIIPPKPKSTTFTEVAAEYFIMPLVNRFWLFLRDEQTREDRTAYQEGRHRYHGAGTGLILNPLILAQFIRALAVLVNASQNAPEWLSLIAPDSLDLAVTLGTRPVSQYGDADSDDEETTSKEKSQGKEASVLTSALELALVILDGCLEVDDGRTMSLEHTPLVLAVGEWANKVFTTLEAGMKLEGGGGLHEVSLRRAAAGVLLKVDSLTSRWRRSMIDVA